MTFFSADGTCHTAFDWSLTSGWLTSYLTGRTVRQNGLTSSLETVRYGVLQGSVLGPLLFLLDTADGQHFTTRHGFRSHYYVDDSQLHMSCRPDEAQQRVARERTAVCIVDINLWMRSNRLCLNPSKTEFLWCATARRIQYVNPESIHIGDINITSSASVRNLAILMDGDFSMTTHVKEQVRSCFHSTPDSMHSAIAEKRGHQDTD